MTHLPARLRMHLLKGKPLLYKHQGRYHAIFYDRQTRRRKWYALGTDRKSVASERFYRIRNAYEAGDFNPFRDRFEFDALTVGEAARRFQAAKAQEWAPDTRRDYRAFLGLVERSVPAGMSLVHLSPSDCSRIVSGPITAAGKRGYYRRLRSFLNWCVRKKYLDHSPLEEVSQARDEPQPVEYFTRAQIDELVERIEKDAAGKRAHYFRRLSRIVRFTVATGLRLRELTRLRWRDVDREAGTITVLGKRSKRRAVPLFGQAREVLREIEVDHLAQFSQTPPRDLEVFAGMPYSETSKDFKRYVRAAAIGEEYTFHSLRKTFASWLVMGGVDIFRVSTWLGHSSVVITQRTYAHLAPGYVPAHASEVFAGSVLALPKLVRKRSYGTRRRKSLQRK